MTKLLDFGLAKPAATLTSAATLTAAVPTSPVTEDGTIVGTFQYMSPEQVEGKELDGRSDIFSLGAVLYEMLTGHKAFAGKNPLSVASAILEKDPQPISTIKPLPPSALDHAVKKSLAKLPDERWQSASDLASELNWIGESAGQAAGTALLGSARKGREKVAWLLAGASMVALFTVAIWWRNSKPTERMMQFYAPMPFPARASAIAPNGHTLAVVANRESAQKNLLYELGSPSARSLADTEGASFPFWSPDGRSLAFFADAKLKKLEVSGGPVATVCDAPSGRGGT